LSNRDYFINAGVSVGVLVAAWLIRLLTRHAINRFSRRRNLAELDPGAETRLRMIQHLVTVALFFVAVGLVLWIMDLSALKRVAVGMFASAGVVGIALAFAAQTTMANLVSGIIIAFAQPIRLGDNVTIDDEYGSVESIGLFYTGIRTWDNRRLIIPNKLLSDQTIRNYTIVDARMPAVVVLRLDYRADMDAVRGVLLSEARAHRVFLPDPAPSVQVIEANELGVSVRLTAWTATQGDAWTMAVDVRESVIRKLASSSALVGVLWSTVVTQRPMS
jgi:small conductance mechanosensitive channel